MSRKSQLDPYDLVGMKVGKLEVKQLGGFYKTETHGKDRYRSDLRPYYICQCECGNIEEINRCALKSNRPTKSCGCLFLETRNKKEKFRKDGKTPFENAVSGIYSSYKKDAFNRGYSFEVNKEDFAKLITSPCYYCGIEWSNYGGRKSGEVHKIKYNGIDRLNNDLGYFIDNIVPACFHCNLSKRTRTVEEFQCWVKQVYNHMQLNETKDIA